MRDGKRERDVGCSIFCTRATRARAVILKIEFEPRTMERLPTMEHTIVRKSNKREKHLTGIRNTTPQHIEWEAQKATAYTQCTADTAQMQVCAYFACVDLNFA